MTINDKDKFFHCSDPLHWTSYNISLFRNHYQSSEEVVFYGKIILKQTENRNIWRQKKQIYTIKTIKNWLTDKSENLKQLVMESARY